MKITRNICAAAMALGLTSTFPFLAVAETFESSGKTCWSGEVEYMGTTEKDKAWVFKIDYVFLSEDGVPREKGRCFGSGGLVDGEADIATKFCTVTTPSGGTFMSQHKGDGKGATGFYFGGVDHYENMVGGFESGEIEALPVSEDGVIAGCRNTTRKMTFADQNHPMALERRIATSFLFDKHQIRFIPALKMGAQIQASGGSPKE